MPLKRSSPEPAFTSAACKLQLIFPTQSNPGFFIRNYSKDFKKITRGTPTSTVTGPLTSLLLVIAHVGGSFKDLSDSEVSLL